MSEKIVVPVLGESITEATVSKWLKNEGDTVDVDEPIVELETDKVNLEVPSPVSGILSEINSKDGATVEVGALLGTVSTNGKEAIKKNKINKIEPTSKEDKIVNLEISQKEPNVFDKEPREDFKNEEPLVLKDEEEPLVLTNEIKKEIVSDNKTENQTLSPAVRKIIDENEIDIQTIKGTGKDGRILKGDLISLMGSKPQPSERKIKYGPEERIKMTRLRQTIAKRLKQEQHKKDSFNYNDL